MVHSVLVVDDSPTEALRARLLLEREGYQVSLASDGKEALDLAQQQQPDLVILDTVMPRMSGYEAYQRLRVGPRTAHIPILMLLTEVAETDTPRRLGTNGDVYIVKPYRPPLLLAAVEEASRAHEPTNGSDGSLQPAHALGVGGVVLVDGTIAAVDAGAEALFGRAAEEVASQPFAGYLLDEAGAFQDMISRARSDGAAQGQFRVQLPDAEDVRWWRMSASCNGKDALDLVCMDVTDLARARQEAEEARRAKTEFLANMSHELRTPLHEIMGMHDLVLETELRPEQQQYLGTARTSADSLLAMISDILEFSEIEAGQVELEERPFDLRSVLTRTTEMMMPQAQEKGLDLCCQISPQVPVALVGDPRRLRQVLGNLVSNAIKFTDQGQVAVQVGIASGAPAPAAGEDVQFHFLVRDTGVGIPDEQRRAIFEPFSQADNTSTRQHGGIGLRLDIARQLVELMGGRIWVDSEVGEGTTFHFTLSLTQQDQAAQPSAATAPPVQERDLHLHILLAEDSATNQLIAVTNLKKAGHTVEVAGNGQLAMEALEREEFDLILMDVAMPVMDGLEATRAIRQRELEIGGHMPIVAMTAFATKEYQNKCMDAGMDGYVTKPLKAEQLCEVIDTFLAQRSQAEVVRQAASPPPVDLDAALEIVGGDTDLLHMIVEVSMEECPTQIQALEEALAAQNAAGVEHAAHTLKGVVANVGSGPVRDLAQQLETMGERGDLAQAPSVLQSLLVEMDRLVAFFSDPGWDQDLS